MTIQETHIRILQDIQKMNSYAVENLLPEEIDLHLNKFTKKFVDGVLSRLKPNEPTFFQHNQRVIDQVRTLLVKNYRIVPEVGSDNIVSASLPSNYRHLVSDASEVVITKDKEIEEKEIHIYPFLLLADGTEVGSFQLEKERVVVFDSAHYFPDGLYDADLNYQLVDILKGELDSVYWEEYDTYRKANTMLLVSEKPIELNVKIGEEVKVVEGTPIGLKKYKLLNGYRYIKPNRLHRDANLHFIQQHPFERTVWESPISSMSGNKLHVYEDKEFAVASVIIDYIKSPAKVSKEFGIHSNLPEDAQELVIEQTIAHIKAVLNDPSWNVTTQENQLLNN